MLHLGFCSVCGAGARALRACGGCATLVVQCDECDAVWTEANVMTSPLFLKQPELPCPHCTAPLATPPSHWATAEEASAAAWVTDAVANGVITLSSGHPFGDNSPPVDRTDSEAWNKFDLSE
jgi:hypothetical protein